MEGANGMDDRKLSQNEIRKTAARLRNRADWNPERVLGGRESLAERVASESRSVQADRTYSETANCQACEAERRSLGDETALCEAHFEGFMDFHS